jgi:Uma2 family endonuclease
MRSMNAPFLKPWTQEQFFAWAAHQEGHWEFDGFRPVAMNGGTVRHAIIIQNLHAALRARLRGTGCRPLGPGAGLATIGAAVRYPDALVTCSSLAGMGEALLIPSVVAVFEVLSPTSGRNDRIVKVREYAAVQSMRRYVILESTGIGLQVLERTNANDPWRATALTGDDILRMPEIGIEVPVSEFYEDVDFGGDAETAETPA